MSAEAHQVCPECLGWNLENWQLEYGTGVVAPDGVEERIIDGGVGCRDCGWSGDEDELAQEPDGEKG